MATAFDKFRLENPEYAGLSDSQLVQQRIVTNQGAKVLGRTSRSVIIEDAGATFGRNQIFDHLNPTLISSLFRTDGLSVDTPPPLQTEEPKDVATIINTDLFNLSLVRQEQGAFGGETRDEFSDFMNQMLPEGVTRQQRQQLNRALGFSGSFGGGGATQFINEKGFGDTLSGFESRAAGGEDFQSILEEARQAGIGDQSTDVSTLTDSGIELVNPDDLEREKEEQRRRVAAIVQGEGQFKGLLAKDSGQKKILGV